ncbi:MAG: hypothetical protein A3I68_00145 [Candidatus Melainabacteria bacterium RIFCSPLOWO2_02_FULL_35_15]|nr:MAG: hypothetical protein A3F80_00925 [Candidatus Melainabacteria bacterium RIFCSPLOWO2_12_FULL_35_11]OGI14805.1 MAG: hypothetical protein A3I68_00145 [Candidatus Melainabacteria bacterium RIFCSPLOWO2_02_FULL_35_15]
MNRTLLFIILFIISLNPSFAIIGYEQGLNYDDLVELSRTSSPFGELKQKLENQLNVPVIVRPPRSETDFLNGMTIGKFFRIASWNIERGFNADKIENIFAGRDLPEQVSGNSALNEEFNILRKASIIILNEVDIGMPRTKYQNIAHKLAETLKMGYIFGTEFIEVDPYQLGIKKFTNETKTFLEPQILEQLNNIDKSKFKGLHGTAILSKYPILNARIIRLPECYPWYQAESKKISTLELARREAAEKIFSSKVLTELRHGGRMAIITELMLPNKNKITVVATHLENRCMPECRIKEMEFLLGRLRNIKNPLILGGDFNTTGTDASPVSVKKEILKRVKDPQYIAKQAIVSLTPVTLAQNLILNTANVFRQFKDPTTKHIPVILPNKERKFFDLLKEFKFNDGGAFDVRGISKKTHLGHAGLLSNSNERELKGFKPTFELERNLGIAKYKLDWFFVKPLSLKDSNNKNGSYAYAPHFGRTLGLVNRVFGKKISDHDPVTIDVPVGDPSN